MFPVVISAIFLAIGVLSYLIFFMGLYLQLPDYHDIVEHPMDFSTVRKKLANGSYPTLEELEVGDKFVSQVYKTYGGVLLHDELIL